MAGASYFLELTTNLSLASLFTSLATRIAGQPGTTTFIDTNAIPAGQFFYRVGVSVP